MDEMTILNSLINFLGGSITSGITWDILKSNGLKIIDSFSTKLRGYFNNDDKVTKEYLEKICKEITRSNKKPFNDARTIYEEDTDNEFENFENPLSEWIKENIREFIELSKNNINQSGTININAPQTASGNSVINNVVNQVNF
ncbi:hypothetical protein DVW05_06175 [Clostridium botulinum]|uniref:hypothetical protein n=1 Tax=Clostridium sp. ZBS18 TaxID=2949967 RepID=UPI001D9E1AC0|nr:hypothetical protein [Clostridium sp. ZBS18]MBN1054935.1 hypothetical protein [Clostridium botulinum]